MEGKNAQDTESQRRSFVDEAGAAGAQAYMGRTQEPRHWHAVKDQPQDGRGTPRQHDEEAAGDERGSITETVLGAGVLTATPSRGVGVLPCENPGHAKRPDERRCVTDDMPVGGRLDGRSTQDYR